MNLEKIRQIGITSGLSRADQEMSQEALVELIFVSSFSTKASTTTISGRGVGMDAIREEFVQGGDSLHIELLSQQQSIDSKLPFRIVGQLPTQPFFNARDSAAADQAPVLGINPNSMISHRYQLKLRFSIDRCSSTIIIFTDSVFLIRITIIQRDLIKESAASFLIVQMAAS